MASEAVNTIRWVALKEPTSTWKVVERQIKRSALNPEQKAKALKDAKAHRKEEEEEFAFKLLKDIAKCELVEEKGREIASERDKPVSPDDERFAKDALHCTDSIRYDIATYAQNNGYNMPASVLDYLDTLKHTLWELEIAITNARLDEAGNRKVSIRSSYKPRLARFHWCRGLHRAEPPKPDGYDNTVREKLFIDHVDEVNEGYKRSLGDGKGCTWLLDMKRFDYNYTSAVNDLTACMHRGIEASRKLAPSRFEHSGKCIWGKGSNKNVIEACKKWDKLTDTLNQYGLMAKQDFVEISGGLSGSKAEMRVGSATGHTSHIDLKKGTLEYYDSDVPVTNLLAKLMSDRGIKPCEVNFDGMKCKLKPKDIDNAMIVLSFATSGDFRQNNPSAYEQNYMTILGRGVVPECYAKTVGSDRELQEHPDPIMGSNSSTHYEHCLITELLKKYEHGGIRPLAEALKEIDPNKPIVEGATPHDEAHPDADAEAHASAFDDSSGEDIEGFDDGVL